MTEPSNTECAFCENCAPVDSLEGFPKYVVVDDVQFRYFMVCRDCFEIAYRGATESHRRWNVSAQCVVTA